MLFDVFYEAILNWKAEGKDVQRRIIERRFDFDY